MKHTAGAQVGTARRALLLALALALVALPVFAAPAMAGPPGPTLTVAELETKLASGPMDGFFLTVIGGASQDPVRVPVSVLSVVPNQTIDGALILFEASGPVIDKAGGVAFGMSGSPVYVDDGGICKLIGAVSYGPMGASALGMATPVEYMAAMQADFPAKAATLTLPDPVPAGGGMVSKVTIVPTRRAARQLQPRAGTMVMAPLATLTIGMPASSPAYKKAAARLAKHGVDAMPAATRTGGGDFSTPFVPGASLAAMVVTGDGWGGYFGTATYVDGDAVVGFGHPIDGSGSVGFDLANGFVGGVWPGLFGPEKIFAPGAVAGTLTQDRTAGVAGRLDLMPPQVPITSTITFNGKTITSTSAMPQWAIDGVRYSWFVDIGPWVAMMMATKQYQLVGSATTTTEVKLSDGTTNYDVRLDNVWDDSWDVISWCTGDLDTILYSLTANYDGVAPMTITEVDFTAELSPVHRGARIVDVSVPGGLKTGANTVTTTLIEYSNPVPQTVTTTLTIPKGMVNSGYVQVSAPGWYDYYDEMFYGAASGGVSGPETVADIVADLQALGKNSDLQVTFEPKRPVILPPPATDPVVDYVEGMTPMTSALSGSIAKQTGSMRLVAPLAVRRGGSAKVRGVISAVSGHTSVRIYKRAAGQTKETFVKKVTAIMNADYEATFSFSTGPLRTATRYTAVWDGDDESVGATAKRLIRIRLR